MEKTGRSQPVRRFEDERLPTGKGRCLDDFTPNCALHAVFLRSPIARARIRAIDTEDAAAADGVHLVLSGVDPEAMLPDNASRDLVSETEPGLDADRRIVACRVKSLSNPGAYNSVAEGIGQPLSARVVHDGSRHLPTATFMEYSMPLADNLAMFGVMTEPVPWKAIQLERDGSRRGWNRRRVGRCRQRGGRRGLGSRGPGDPDSVRAVSRCGRC